MAKFNVGDIVCASTSSGLYKIVSIEPYISQHRLYTAQKIWPELSTEICYLSSFVPAIQGLEMEITEQEKNVRKKIAHITAMKTKLKELRAAPETEPETEHVLLRTTPQGKPVVASSKRK